MKKTGAML